MLRWTGDGQFYMSSGTLGKPIRYSDTGLLTVADTGDFVTLTADGLQKRLPQYLDTFGYWPLSGLVMGTFEDVTPNANDGLPDTLDNWTFHSDGGVADTTSGRSTIVFPATIDLLPPAWEMHLLFRASEAANRFGVRLPVSGGGWWVRHIDNLTPHQWHTIEVEYDPAETDILIWVDGMLEAQGTAAIDWRDNTAMTLNFGPGDDNQSPYIRDFRIKTYVSD